ncbi:hypothetical protein GCM10023093_30120 [Nemorincola caseinilytica]|uniref:T9SS C-terminal target domain-containing protein n=2 Tax=Nemorincola caseinilytica TaxID=2054315 RepID=A0ABP8NQY8_9BACT
MSLLSLSAHAQTTAKLSTLTKKYVHDMAAYKGKPQQGYIYNRGNDGTVYISALIRVADAGQAQTGLDAIGAHIGTRAGSIWTVKVPVDKVSAFITATGISYIQLDEPVYPQLDMARKTTRVDSVHGGYDLPIAYTGRDVVVGVIDFGFDYNHPTFYDTTNTTYRIKKVWQMNGTAAPPAGYTYGKELVGEAAIKAEGTDDPRQNHGTCVAGMAAGSGYGAPAASPRKYRGMAYESDMVMVCVRRDSIGGQWMAGSFSDFLDGVNYIFNYATSVGKPCVVNISWGSQSGSHDGTSLFNEACNSMSGPGKLIVMSAGNEGQENIHIAKTFTATDTTVQSFLTFNPTTVRRTWVDIWGQPGKTFCAKATLYTNGTSTAGQTTGYKCIDNAVTDMFLIGANGIDTCYVQFITSSAEDNGKPRITVNINNKSTDTILVSVKGNDGKIDMWDEYYYYGFPYKYQSAFFNFGQPYAVAGNNASTVSDMGSATSVLLVGAYASKVNFVDINGNSWSYSSYVLANKLVPFSSRGPMVDGRISPDITAPGLTIATAQSSYDTSHTATGTNSNGTVYKYTDGTGKDYYYSEFSGTSASAPAASGIVALLLQANPALTPAALKTVLFSSAITDTYTGTLPAAGNNNWGHGKINAYGALKKVLTDLSTFTYTGTRPDCVLYPNPSNGNFSLDHTATAAGPVSVSVYNMAGVMVYSKLWQVAAGENRLGIPLADVAKGMYVVKVSSPKGTIAIQAAVR